MRAALQADLQVAGRLAVSLAADPGEVVAVVGPNGAGKTTLLQALAGLVPVEGRITMGDTDLDGRPTRERHLGVVFQDQRLFPHLSALENVAFGPRSRGVRRHEARARAHEWLTRLDIADLARRRPKELSGGQAQRVAIARALAAEPDLLLLDEPFAGLDVGVAASLRLELAQHLAEFPGITLLVTHDALDALTLATRLLVLDRGSAVQSGSPDEVAARPRTEHVARLVGLNVLREHDTFRAFAPSSVAVSLTRPEGSARNCWSGRVRSAAPHGDAVRLRIIGEVDLIADVTPGAVRELALAPGRAVWLSVKETAVTTYSAVRGRG